MAKSLTARLASEPPDPRRHRASSASRLRSAASSPSESLSLSSTDGGEGRRTRGRPRLRRRRGRIRAHLRGSRLLRANKPFHLAGSDQRQRVHGDVLDPLRARALLHALANRREGRLQRARGGRSRRVVEERRARRFVRGGDPREFDVARDEGSQRAGVGLVAALLPPAAGRLSCRRRGPLRRPWTFPFVLPCRHSAPVSLADLGWKKRPSLCPSFRRAFRRAALEGLMTLKKMKTVSVGLFIINNARSKL